MLNSCAQQQSTSGAASASSPSLSVSAQTANVVVGVAWRPNAESLSHKSTCRALEAVERADKTYAVGVQFHPEISIQKKLDNAANAQDYLDYDTALKLFERLQEEGASSSPRTRRTWA